MKTYRITLRPVEPFFLGGERNVEFTDKGAKEAKHYYLVSEAKPSQTTLLGTLRYAVLDTNHALITDFSDGAQLRRARELVGEASFDLSKARDFCSIHSISPLFLIHHGKMLIPTPKNHNGAGQESGKKCYSPYHAVPCEDGVVCSGTISHYLSGFNAKVGCGSGWMSLEDGKIFSEEALFSRVAQTGISSGRIENCHGNDNSFFKKERVVFRDRTDVFAFYADLNEDVGVKLCSGTTVYMGQNRSPFLLSAQEENNHLADTVADVLGRFAPGEHFYYALSDCYALEMPEGFYSGEGKSFRYMTTTPGKPNRYERIRRSAEQYRLFCAGSVFYGTPPVGTSACEPIGMNCLIEIGGK